MNESEICKKVREELALQGRAPEDETIRAHLASCDECARFLERLSILESELGSLGDRDVSDETVSRLLARPELRKLPTVRWRRWAAGLGVAAALALVVFSQRMLFFGRKDFSREPELASAAIPRNERNEPEKKLKDEKDQPPMELQFGEELGQAKTGVVAGAPEGGKQEGAPGAVLPESEENRLFRRDTDVVDKLAKTDEQTARRLEALGYTGSADQVVGGRAMPVELGSASALLEDRARTEGLHFLEPRGYWANTYVPGDPVVRRLAARLEREAPNLPHRDARPAALPLDASSTSALSFTLHADRRGITGKSRLLVQLGIRAADRESRRRPPMNVAVVLDLPLRSSSDEVKAAGALLQSLEAEREPGDRFRLIATGPGGGEILSPDAFRRGPLLVALQDLEGREPGAPATSFTDAVALAYEKVLADDDPTQPLGTSLVLVVAGRALGAEIQEPLRLASQGAIGGVTLSAVGFDAADRGEVERLAVAGQGRAYALDQHSPTADAGSIVDRELSAGSRTVARAIRLRIELAEGVQLVNIFGSAPLTERESERTRSEELAIDRRLARNLGIEADRGKDENGIQIVIPAFYAGDSHSILLDVVVSGPGPIAEVTARYKDLLQLQNTVSQVSLALPRSEESAGPLETSVLKDYLDFLVSQSLRDASTALRRSDLAQARKRLSDTRALLAGIPAVLPELSGDRDVQRDVPLLDRYLALLSRSGPNAFQNLYDSLRYASALKRLWHPLS